MLQVPISLLSILRIFFYRNPKQIRHYSVGGFSRVRTARFSASSIQAIALARLRSNSYQKHPRRNQRFHNALINFTAEPRGRKIKKMSLKSAFFSRFNNGSIGPSPTP